MSYIYLSLAVLMISGGQILQKLAANEVDTQNGMRAAISSLGSATHFWTSILAMGFGLVMWLAALSDMDVSRAYPILGSSFVLTSVLSALVLGERIDRNRWIGVGLISVGVAIMVSN